MRSYFSSLSIIVSIMIFCASGLNAAQKIEASELPPDSIVVPHSKPPKLIHEEEPDYPRLAREGGFGARLTIKSFIDENGEVAGAKAISCSRPNMGFEESAVRAEYGCRYEPARSKKEPVGVWIVYDMKFDPQTGVSRGPIHSHKLK